MFFFRTLSASKVSSCFLFLLAFLPFIQPYHAPPLNSFYTEWIALFLGASAFFAFFFTSKHYYWIPIPCLWLFLLSLWVLAYPLLSNTNYTDLIWIGSFYLFWASLVLFLASNLMNIEMIAPAILFGSLVNVVICIYQKYTIGFVLGALSQPNHTADYIAMGFVAATYLYFQRRLQVWAYVISCGLFAIALGSTMSRSVFLYIGSLVILSLYLLIKHRSERYRLLFFISLVFFTIVAFCSYSAVQRIQVEASTMLTPTISADNLRLYLWVKAWDLFVASPLYGIGFGQFYVPLHNEFSTHSHNIILQILAESGIVGFILFFFTIYKWSRAVRLHLMEAWFVFGCLGILMIHSLLEYPLWYANFLGLASLLLAVSSFENYRIKEHYLLKSLHLFVSIAMVVGLIWMLDIYRGWEEALKPIPYTIVPTGEGESEIRTPEGSGLQIRIIK